MLDVEGVSTFLGVSTSTISNLVRQGKSPAMRVGREWRFARQNLMRYVTNGSEADQLTMLLGKGGVAKQQRCTFGIF